MWGSDFELDFVRLIPMISKAVAVPVFANLFRRVCVRNAASLIVLIFAHLCRPLRGLAIYYGRDPSAEALGYCQTSAIADEVFTPSLTVGPLHRRCDPNCKLTIYATTERYY